MNANAEKAHWHTATDASDPRLPNFQTCGILIDSILKRNMLVADMLFQIPRPSKKKWWFVNSEEYAVLI